MLLAGKRRKIWQFCGQYRIHDETTFENAYCGYQSDEKRRTNNMTKMEQSGCKLGTHSEEPQRNLNGLLMEVTQSLGQAMTLEDVLSGMGTPVRQTFRNQLVEHLLGKLKKITTARVEGKTTGGDDEAASMQSIYRYEEFLWHKAHYDPIAKAKKIKLPQLWDAKQVTSMRSFLQDGINFYLNLLEKLASSSCPKDGPVNHIVARCFVRLGDLARYYCVDLTFSSSSALCFCAPGLYYMQALEVCPNNGLIHSNLAAVLINVEGKTCSAVLHYLAALLCQHHQARVLMRPILEVSVRFHEALLDDNSLLVLGSNKPAHSSFQHTLLTVLQVFLHRTYDPNHLQISESTTTSCSERSPERTTAATGSPASAGPRKTARRAPRRRRRIRRQPSLGEDSSCEEDGAESDWSGTTCSVDFSDVLCSSSDEDDDLSDEEQDSGPDAIIESDSEDRSVSAVPGKMTEKVADRGASLLGSSKGSAENLSALKHLFQLAKLEDVTEAEKQCLNSKGVRSCGSGETKTAAASAPGLLIAAKVVCSWLLSASTTEGDIVWCVEPDVERPVNSLGHASGANCKSGSVNDPKDESGLSNGTKTEKMEPQNNRYGTVVSGCVAHSGRHASDETGRTSNRGSSFAHHGSNDRPGRPCEGQTGRGGGSSEHGAGQSSSGANQGVGIMWEALAVLCNVVSVDLKLLCSEDYSNDLPNVTDFLKSVVATKAFSVDAWSQLDNFTLPEDDLLRSILPGVVADHVCKEEPRALVGYLLESLQSLGIHQQKDCVLPVLEANAPVTSRNTTSQLMPYSRLNAAEMTLIRTMRLRKTVFQLTSFVGCPLEYDARTRAFYLVSDEGTMPYADTDTSQKNPHSNVENEDPEGFYYVRGKAMNQIIRNKFYEREHYPTGTKSDRRSRPRPKPRFHDGQKPDRKYRPRRRRRRDHYSNYEDVCKSSVEKEHEQRQNHDRGTSNPDQTFSDKGLTGGKSYRQDRLVGRRTPELTIDNVNNLQSQYVRREHRSSLSVSSDDRSTDPRIRVDIGGSRRYSPVLSSDDKNTSTGAQRGRFSREDSLMGRGTPSPISDDQRNGGMGDHLDESKGQRLSPAPSVASEEEKTRKRQADQQLLTERWLRHELSKSTVNKPDTASATTKFTYIVPDALALSYHRPTLTALLKLENAVVVPLQVLSHLDDLKRRMGAARDASRWLEHQVRRTLPGGRLRLQGNAEHRRVFDVQYPARQHKMPWRWYQILECCHYLARLEYTPESTKSRLLGSLYSDRIEASTSRPGTPKLSSRSDEDDDREGFLRKKPVVMLLTGETRDTIGKLPFSLYSLTASVGTELYFAGEMQKTLPIPPKRGRT
ncbi:PIN domain [Trinorchestia longiramus]|nr:PIN domain [Trinorchestia longiramus]